MRNSNNQKVRNLNVKREFYEEAYPLERKPVKIKGALGVLYNLLKRYEVHRENIAFKLFTGGKAFLDIGCGDGNLVFRMLSKYQKCIGLDIAGTRMEIARSNRSLLESDARRRVSFIEGDADEKLPFDNNSVNAVAMIASLEHFFDPFRIFEEITRILEKNGSIVIQVPNLAFLPRRLAVFFGRLPDTSEDDTGWDGGHLHYFTVGSLKSFLESFGYSVEKITCSGIFAKVRQPFVSLLGADIIIKARKIK